MSRSSFLTPVGRGQTQGLKQHRRKLLGGVDVKSFSDRLINLFFKGCQEPAQLDGEIGEKVFIERHTGHFHICQNSYERHFYVQEKVPQFREAFEFLLQHEPQAQGGFGVRCGIGGRTGNIDSVHGTLVLA